MERGERGRGATIYIYIMYLYSGGSDNKIQKLSEQILLCKENGYILSEILTYF